MINFENEMSENGNIIKCSIADRRRYDTHTSMSEKDALTLYKYLRGIDGVHTIQCDEPYDAIKGFTSFYETAEEDDTGNRVDMSIIFGWQFAKPVIEKTCISYIDTPEEAKVAMEMLEKCITEDGWVKCDNATSLRMGFVKYADLDSDEESELIELTLSSYHVLPQEFVDRIEKWKKDQLTDAERELVESIESLKDI